MARLYANENFPLPAVEELRRLGHNVLTTEEAGNADRSMADEAVLSYAISDDRAVVTLNRKHFVRLHEQRPSHRGIIVCTVDNDFRALAIRIHAEIQTRVGLENELVRVNRP